MLPAGVIREVDLDDEFEHPTCLYFGASGVALALDWLQANAS